MYTDRDFRGMRIQPINQDPEYDKIFKGMPAIVSFNGYKPHKKKIVNYILLMYDPASPFVKKYQNIKKRIESVCDYTGLSKVKEITRVSVTQYKDPVVLEMIDQYVKFINVRIWSLIVVHEATFHEYETELLLMVNETGSKDKLTALTIKTKILDAIDNVAKKLDGYYSQLYANDENIEKEMKAKTITPEGIASGESYA